MAANSLLKYPLCVEWTTELPFKHTPCKSTNISLWGSVWFLELKCGIRMGELAVTLNNASPSNFVFKQTYSVTTSLGSGESVSLSHTGETPMLTEQRKFSKSSNYLWKKSAEKVLSEIPNIFLIGKMNIVCIFHSIETNAEETLVLRQIDSTSPFQRTVTSSLQRLYKDFSAFLKDETFSDVKLICADRVFSAHKLVLAAHSEIFADMFRNKIAEGETGVIDIKDMDPDVLELVLQYMYSGKRPELQNRTAHRLYVAANRYAVHGLKRTCSDWMLRNHSTVEFLDLLVLADAHSDEYFKESVACILGKKLTSLSAASWSTFKEKYPQLAFLVLEKPLLASGNLPYFVTLTCELHP